MESNTNQRWFILIALLALSAIGAVGLVFGAPAAPAGWVFGTPLGVLCAWGFARNLERYL